jgi:outer membrane protein
MRNLAFLLMFTVWTAGAQVRTVTLREAVQLALKQNPDITLARLDERKADEAVRVARSPFLPSVVAGSGLAYSNGMPMSIQGATPSIVQAQASASILNRRQGLLTAQARENVRGAAIDTAASRNEVALRTALAYLDAERASRLAEMERGQVQSLERIAQTVRLRVQEGRELPLESKRAELSLAKSRQRLQALEADQEYYQGFLASLMGFDAGEEIRVAVEDRQQTPLAASEAASVQAALGSSQELRRLESAILAKGLEARANKAAKLPQVDLIAQYALLGKYNNYQDYFNKFQRHNGEIGLAIQVPLFSGSAPDALAAQAQIEASRLKLQLQGARNRISLESRRLYQQTVQAAVARDVARLDLEVARDQLSVLLAQMDEGRASLRQVEEVRLAENEKWMAFAGASYTLEAARLNLLGQTGELIASLR